MSLPPKSELTMVMRWLLANRNEYDLILTLARLDAAKEQAS